LQIWIIGAGSAYMIGQKLNQQTRRAQQSALLSAVFRFSRFGTPVNHQGLGLNLPTSNKLAANKAMLAPTIRLMNPLGFVFAFMMLFLCTWYSFDLS